MLSPVAISTPPSASARLASLSTLSRSPRQAMDTTVTNAGKVYTRMIARLTEVEWQAL
ncbi:hypothetical protein D9M70_593490 [compost metagenome]